MGLAALTCPTCRARARRQSAQLDRGSRARARRDEASPSRVGIPGLGDDYLYDTLNQNGRSFGSISQLGKRRECVFVSDDYRPYRDLLREPGEKAGMSVWAYCLMPNHIRLVLVPYCEEGWGAHSRSLLAHPSHSAYVRFLVFSGRKG